MKRAFFVLTALIITFLLGSATAFADSIDLSAYSESELISLKESIYEEMLARGMIKSAIIPQGKYAIGIDIPAGTYTVTTEANRNWVEFAVYSDSEYTNKVWSTIPSVNNPIGKIELEDGMYIEIVRATMTFTVYNGINFD